MKLSRDLKAKINRLAHNAGLAHAEQVKARLSAAAERRIAAGESLATITAYLDNPGQPQCAVGCASMHDLPTTAEAFGDLPIFDTTGLLDGEGFWL